MKTFYKEIAFTFTASILISLCLTLTVFATEAPPVATPSATVEENPSESKSSKPNPLPDAPAEPDALSEPPAATPFVAAKTAPPEADTVSTGEELFRWLSDHEDTGGAVKLSNDIYLHNFIYVHGLQQPAVTIDTGEFSIIADGYAELHAGSPFTIRGRGSETGVLRAAAGSMLQVNGLILEAEAGYAAFQEEGAGFLMEQTSVSGAVHYASLPYVLQWEDALVVAESGQLFDGGQLPAVLQGRVIRQGRITDFHEDIPVTWDLNGHEEAQKQRWRFTVSGQFENMTSPQAPICTVVYDDFPLTFLEVKASRITGGRGDVYKFTGSFSKPEDRLPITISQEYSLDGKNWMLYEKTQVDRPDGTFTIYLSAEEGEQSPPVIFIRLSWNDGGTIYHSNVLRFEGGSLEESGEHGGNRVGGTDIINPPEEPEPDPEPSEPETSLPPETSEPETSLPPESSEPEPPQQQEASKPETSQQQESSEPEPPQQQEASKPETLQPPESSEPEPPQQQESSESETSQQQESSEPETTEQPKSPEPETIQPASAKPGRHSTDHETGGTGDGASWSPEDNSQAAAKPGERSSPRRPDAGSVVAGFTAIAASIGGAVLCLHPKARKRFVGKLWHFLKP